MASDILRRARLVRREIFEPTNEEHIASFKVFLATGSWGAIQFYPEDPYTDAPATVMAKYARHALGVEVETLEQRAERITGRNIIVNAAPEPSKEERLANANRLLNEAMSRLEKAEA